MNEFKEFLKYWNAMCIRPVGNNIVLSPLDEYWINEIKSNLHDFLTEDSSYYIIKYAGNTIKIEK